MARWMVFGVLAIDLAVVVMLTAGPVSTLVASTTALATAPAAVATVKSEPAATAELLQQLGARLAERTAALELREAEIAELLRSEEVLRRAGLSPNESEGAEASGATAAGAESQSAAVTSAPATDDPVPRASVAFLSLQRAYENMEPESAARALAELAARDKEAVVQLLLGWKPRTSGAILDALTQANPALAADLSYEIWKLDGARAAVTP
jgi:flagellar motility protein MotE (MotC chaperone)